MIASAVACALYAGWTFVMLQGYQGALRVNSLRSGHPAYVPHSVGPLINYSLLVILRPSSGRCIDQQCRLNSAYFDHVVCAIRLLFQLHSFVPAWRHHCRVYVSST